MTNTPDKSEMKAASYDTTRAIPHEEAMEAAHRLINSHFGNKDRARCSIPANPDRDDDLVLCAYIRQQAASSRPPADQVADMVERVARRLCEARGENPAGSQVRFVDGAAHSATFLEIAKRDVQTVIAALQAVPATSEVGWQPIESAPKDGSVHEGVEFGGENQGDWSITVRRGPTDEYARGEPPICEGCSTEILRGQFMYVYDDCETHANCDDPWATPDDLDDCHVLLGRPLIAYAIATEARRAETPKDGSVHEGAVPERQSPKDGSQ